MGVGGGVKRCVVNISIIRGEYIKGSRTPIVISSWFIVRLYSLYYRIFRAVGIRQSIELEAMQEGKMSSEEVRISKSG